MNVATTNAVVTTHTHTMQDELTRGDVEIVSLVKACERLLSSPYRSGRSKHWLKVKNPAAPAVKREAEEDWRR
jgi:hypothetical protein